MIPQRIQRQRTKGWKMPRNTVYVGRGSQWGNPYRVPQYTPQEAVLRYSIHLDGGFLSLSADDVEKFVAPLRGKNLACWCAHDQPCHADVLLALANREVRDAN